MKRLYPFLMIVLIAGFFSCSDDKSGMTPMTAIKNSDSAAVMFYNTPDNPRFFKYTKIKDINLLQPVIDDVSKKIIDRREDCATRGKIYFYGEGDAVDVVYFSTTEKCMTFSFIVTGEKYFARMNTGSKQLLDSLQKEAIEPTGRVSSS